MWPQWGKEQETKAPPTQIEGAERQEEEPGPEGIIQVTGGVLAACAWSSGWVRSCCPVFGWLAPKASPCTPWHGNDMYRHLQTRKRSPDPCGLLLFTASAFPLGTWGSESLPRPAPTVLVLGTSLKACHPRAPFQCNELVSRPLWTQCLWEWYFLLSPPSPGDPCFSPFLLGDSWHNATDVS